MCIAEPLSNLVGKVKPESNLIVAKHELKPRPCDSDLVHRTLLNSYRIVKV